MRSDRRRAAMSILLLVGLGWMYVVSMMAIAEAVSPQGSWLGAVFTFVLYGVLPLALSLYLLATPARRRRQRAREAAAGGPPEEETARPGEGSAADATGTDPPARHAPAAEREGR